MNASLTDSPKESEEKQPDKGFEKEAKFDVEAQNTNTEAGQQNAQDDYFHMPTWRFLFVVVATCLTVLCMALVKTHNLTLFEDHKLNYNTG